MATIATKRWMVGATMVAGLATAMFCTEGCAQSNDEDDELRVAVQGADELIKVQGVGSYGGSSSGGLSSQSIVGQTTSPKCPIPSLIAAAGSVTSADPITGATGPAIGTAFSTPIGSVQDLSNFVASGTYSTRRKALPGKPDAWLTATATRSNVTAAPIYSCVMGADSSAYIPSGSNLSLPLIIIPSSSYIPPAENVYMQTAKVNGATAQFWLGAYNASTGLWSGSNWNWVRHDYSEIGMCTATTCTGAVYNEPKSWVRNGNGSKGTAIKRYGRKTSSGATQLVVLRPAVTAVGDGTYRAVDNGVGVAWNVAVPTSTANAIGNP